MNFEVDSRFSINRSNNKHSLLWYYDNAIFGSFYNFGGWKKSSKTVQNLYINK